MIILVDGKEVRPTEEDVDKCIKYLKVNHRLLCDKTIRDTVREYLKGNINIDQTELERLEKEQKELRETLEKTEELENQVDKEIQKKDKGENQK